MQRLLESLSDKLSVILNVKVKITEVSGADHFYTDGMSVGAAWRISLPDSSLNFLRSDGSVHITFSELWTEIGEAICDFVKKHLITSASV